MNQTMEEVGRLVAPMLQRKMFVVLAEPADPPGGSREEELQILPDHLRYLISLEQRGLLFASGPFLENGQPGRKSMCVLRAASADEAAAIMAEEPYHKRGMRTSTVHEWSLNEGRVSISVDFSSQRAGLDGTPSAIEMAGPA